MVLPGGSTGGTHPWDQGGEGGGPFLGEEALLWGLGRISSMSAEKKVSLGKAAKTSVRSKHGVF